MADVHVGLPDVEMAERAGLVKQIESLRILQNLIGAHARTDPSYQQIGLLFICLLLFCI